MMHSPMFTVVPSSSSRLKVCPAGTVNSWMLIVVHFTADETSSKEAIVPVQALLCFGAAMTDAARTTETRRARMYEKDMAEEQGAGVVPVYACRARSHLMDGLYTCRIL